MPTGAWSVEAISGDFYASGTVVINEFPGPELAVVGQGEQNGEIQVIGLRSSSSSFPCHVLTYSRSGIPIEVRGVKFPQNVQVSLALYRIGEHDILNLVETHLVQAGGTGAFLEDFTFSDPGSYAVFAVWDSSLQMRSYSQFDLLLHHYTKTID